MDVLTTINYLGLFTATYWIMKHIILPRFKNLPPSPPLCLPIIGHLYLLYNPLHRALARLSARYGPILYLQFGARPLILVSSASIAEECLIKNDHIFQNRPAMLATRHQMFNYPTIPWSPQGPHWRKLRKISAVEVLSPQRLKILSGVRDEVGRAFIHRMVNETSSHKNGVAKLEMKSIIFGLTLDNMMRMLVGRSNFQEGLSRQTIEVLTGFQNLVEETFRVSGVGSSVDELVPLVKWLRAVFARKAVAEAEETMMKLNDDKERFMRGLMEEHREMDRQGKLSDSQLKCMLHVLLSSQKNDPQGYTDEMIGSLILVLFQGGTDTSSSAVVWTLSYLLNHPHIIKKAQDEIDKVVGFERLVEENDKNNLPYIKALVNETFRMCPTGPLALPYEAKSECKVAGYRVPQGTMLLYNIWAIQNDPKKWASPRTYDPERFLGPSYDKKFGYEFMPFGIGKRICPGEHLATKVVWLSVAILVQCFQWDRVDGELVDMKEGGGLILAKLDPLYVKCRIRPCMMKLLSKVAA